MKYTIQILENIKKNIEKEFIENSIFIRRAAPCSPIPDLDSDLKKIIEINEAIRVLNERIMVAGSDKYLAGMGGTDGSKELNLFINNMKRYLFISEDGVFYTEKLDLEVNYVKGTIIHDFEKNKTLFESRWDDFELVDDSLILEYYERGLWGATMSNDEIGTTPMLIKAFNIGKNHFDLCIEDFPTDYLIELVTLKEIKNL